MKNTSHGAYHTSPHQIDAPIKYTTWMKMEQEDEKERRLNCELYYKIGRLHTQPDKDHLVFLRIPCS